MKKLIMAAAIVCAAAFAQAATVTWSTEYLYASDGETMIYSQDAEVWSYVASVVFSPTATATPEESWGSWSGTGTDFAYGVGDYTATLTITEFKNGVENATLTSTGTFALMGTAEAPTETTISFSDGTGFKSGTFIGDGAGKWVAAPEPTSGLLLLIGMAGLALRRRRA